MQRMYLTSGYRAKRFHRQYGRKQYGATEIALGSNGGVYRRKQYGHKKYYRQNRFYARGWLQFKRWKFAVAAVVVIFFLFGTCFFTCGPRAEGAGEVIYAEDYGSLQDAIDSAGQGAEVVCEEGKTYYLDGALKIIGKNDVTLNLNGATLDRSGKGTVIWIDGANNITIQSGDIINFSISGIFANNVPSVSFEDLTVAGQESEAPKSTGLSINNSTDIKLTGCSVYNHQVGILLNSSSSSDKILKIKNSELSKNTRAVSITPSPNKSSWLIQFGGSKLSQNTYGVYLKSSRDVYLLLEGEGNCTVENNEFGFYLASEKESEKKELDIKIDGFDIKNNGPGAEGGGGGICIKDAAANSNIEITNNYIQENNSYGLRLDGGNITVAGNIITENSCGVIIESFTKKTGGGDGSVAGYVYGNDIFNNLDGNGERLGLRCSGEEVLPVGQNYWGSGSGPYHAGSNPDGRGDKIEGQISLEKENGWSETAFYQDEIKPSVEITKPASKASEEAPYDLIVSQEESGLVDIEASAGDNIWLDRVELDVYDSAGFSVKHEVYEQAPYCFIWNTWNCAEGIPAVEDGFYTIKVTAVDGKGNSAFDERTVIVDYNAPEQPSIVINDGAEYTSGREVKLVLSATDGAGVTEIRVGSSDDLTGESWSAYNQGVINEITYELESGDGEKRVYAQFRDYGGYPSEVVWDTIVLDTTPPEISIISPCKNSIVSGNFEITLTAEDEYELSLLDVCIAAGGANDECSDGCAGEKDWRRTVDCPEPGGLYSFDFDSTQVSDGTHSVRAVAYDAAGNSQSCSTIFTVDNTCPPAPVLRKPSDDEQEVELQPAFRWSIEDLTEDLTVVSYEFQLAVNSDFKDIVHEAGNIDRAEYVLAGILNQSTTYYWRVRAVDMANNKGEWSQAGCFTTKSSKTGEPEKDEPEEGEPEEDDSGQDDSSGNDSGESGSKEDDTEENNFGGDESEEDSEGENSRGDNGEAGDTVGESLKEGSSREDGCKLGCGLNISCLPFEDVPAGHWAREAIGAMASQGLVRGLGPGKFGPGQDLSRAHFTAFLVRVMSILGLIPELYGFECCEEGTAGEGTAGEGTAGEGTAGSIYFEKYFKDVNAGNWYAAYAVAAAEAGLIEGYLDGTFRGDEKITRQEMALLLARVLKKAGKVANTRVLQNDFRSLPDGCQLYTEVKKEGRQKTSLKEILLCFKDAGKIAPWAELGVACVVQFGIMQGREGGYFYPEATATRSEGVMVIYRLKNFLEK